METQNLSSDELHKIVDNQQQIIENQAEAFLAYEQTWQHIDLVVRLLTSAQIELMRRAVTHDRTKLIAPEREMFAKMTSKLRGLTYGSPEYKECLKEMLGEALGHHYEHNRHHPEFFETREESGEIYNYRKTVCWIANSTVVDSDDTLGRLISYLHRKQEEHISSVNNMNLFDLLEMLIDWIAACQRHANGDINKSIEINTERFALSPQLVQILKNTVPWLHDAFDGLQNQKQISPPAQSAEVNEDSPALLKVDHPNAAEHRQKPPHPGN